MATTKERAQYYVVDKRGEGGLVSELDRVAMVDQPTLIIGLGGTGTDALLHAKYVMQRKLKQPQGKKKPDRLSFLAIDTDALDLKNKQVGGVHLDASELCDLTEPNLATLLHNPEKIPKPYQRDWLCKGINAGTIEYGAGGIRQCGRLMLILKANTIATVIQNKVNEIWGAGKENGANFIDPRDRVNVYILTGISGGTGSGTFLDVAYLTHHIIANLCHHELRMRGVIFMPDVNECKIKSATVKAYLPVNGYAALKELDFWMNAERGRNFKQQYTDLITVNTPKRPFELCFLVSPNGALEEDYTTCLQTTGEALLNILSAPVDQNSTDGNGQNFESYVVNLVSMLDKIKKNYTGNYVFAALGMDERRLQMDQMANYIAYYLLGKVNSLFDREPTDAEVNDCFRKLKLDSKRGMRTLFDRTLPNKPFDKTVRSLDDLREAIKNYKHSDVLDNDVLEEELKAWVVQSETIYGQRKGEVRDEIMEDLGHKIEELFIDLNYGPYYAHRLLHNINVGKKDLLDKLAEEQAAVRSFMVSADDLEENLTKICNEKKQKARNTRLVPLVKDSTYSDYVEAAFKLYDHRRYYKLAQVLNSLYTQLIDEVTQYNNLVVERFSTLLEELARVFESNSEIMAKVDHDGDTHSWNIGNFDKIKVLVDEAFKNLDNDNKTNTLVTDFLKRMLQDREDWVGANGDLGESFSRFVSEKFNTLMQETLEQSYKRMHNLNTDAELESFIQTNVLPQMEAGAKVMYTTDEVLSSLSDAARRSMISYPAAANHIGNAIKSFVDSKTNLSADVVPSMRSGSLFWFESCFGLPLYAHKAIAQYQMAYDVYGHNDHHLGRQLKMGADENWLKLMPPLMPEAVWASKGYANKPLSERNAHVRALMQESWREHRGTLVQPMPGAEGRYVLGTVDRAAYDALIASAPLTGEEQAQLRAEGVAAASTMNKDNGQVAGFVKSAKDFLANGWKPSGDAFKEDVINLLMNGETVATVEQNPDLRMEQILKENLLLTPDLADKLQEQYDLRKALGDLVAVHEIYLQMGDQEAAQRQLFANAWMYGLYRRVVPKVYQLDTTNAGVQTFVLMSINDYQLAPVEDKYYAMFQKFISLTDQQKQIIEKIVKLREAQLANEMGNGVMDNYIKYVGELQKVDKEIADRLAAIDMDISFNRPEIREFYLKVREVFAYWLSEE